jgi:hypothetical protein
MSDADSQLPLRETYPRPPTPGDEGARLRAEVDKLRDRSQYLVGETTSILERLRRVLRQLENDQDAAPPDPA